VEEGNAASWIIATIKNLNPLVQMAEKFFLLSKES